MYGVWYVTGGTYMLQTLGFNGQQVGAAYSSTAFAALVSPLLIGLLADRFFSVERLMGVLHLMSGGLMLIVVNTSDFTWFFPLLVFQACLYIPTMALSSSLCFQQLENPVKDFPRIRVWGTLGWIAGGLLVGAMDWEATAIPMYLSVGASFISGFYSFTLPNTPPKIKAINSLREAFGWEAFKVLRTPAFIVFIVAMLVNRIPTAFYYSFVNPFLNELGVTNAAGKMTLGQMMEVVIMLLLPWFLRRLGLKWVLFIGLFAWGLRYALFALGDGEGGQWLLYAGILLHGFAYNFSALAGQLYVDSLAPRHLRSTAQGFVAFLTLGLGVFIGSFIAGAIVQHYTLADNTHLWKVIWWYPAVIGVLSAIGFWIFFKRES